MSVTHTDLFAFVQSHHRVIGKLPTLRECVDHFDGKALNVRLALCKLPAEQADWIRNTGRAERVANRARKAPPA